jgi:hypothetical protein
MALPTYNRNNRRKTFEQLPKGAYVVKILGAKIAQSTWGATQLVIQFDIAEGEYKDFYRHQYDRNSNEDKKWPVDGVFYLEIPGDGSAEYVVTNYDTFFADLEDSNNGFVFAGDEKTLKGKLIGAKMRIKGRMYKGNPYTNTQMRWTCPAQDVRDGKAGNLPNDYYPNDWNPNGTGSEAPSANDYATSGFSSGDDDEIPFD